jgi:hypothetical protein
MPTTGPVAVVVPNYADMWRVVAAQEARYAPDAANAEQDAVRWRRRLAPLALGEPIAGAPFPGTDRPTFWLYLRP